ncbi:MAG TPA: phosphate-starvation-inducible PsiE family protein [Anaerolineales bacterium]|nr:phosphate-starvation-inducible PsiE family protein [Anaerolineales bacterium]
MKKFLHLFEKSIVTILILIMVLIIILATLTLVGSIVTTILPAGDFLPDDVGLLDIFGYVLLILIGIELLETIKAYLSEHVVHVEVVLEVAMIAVARKVILLDYHEYSGLTVLAIAALILALAIGYYLEKRSRRSDSRVESQMQG